MEIRIPRFYKKVLLSGGSAVLALLLFTFVCNKYVERYSNDFIQDDLSHVPSLKFGLLPGTSKYFAKNDKNTFYQSRLNAAFLLYKFRKVQRIVVSGTSEKFYDEPRQLRSDLKKMGIPDSAIIIDASGVHTLESIQFLKRMETDSVIIISQHDHLQRAVFLARKSGIEAYGYAAPDPVEEHRKVKLREYFAKVKAVIDVWFL